MSSQSNPHLVLKRCSVHYAEHEVTESEHVKQWFPVIRTSRKLKSEFVQTVQDEVKVLEVLAQK